MEEKLYSVLLNRKEVLTIGRMRAPRNTRAMAVSFVILTLIAYCIFFVIPWGILPKVVAGIIGLLAWYVFIIFLNVKFEKMAKEFEDEHCGAETD